MMNNAFKEYMDDFVLLYPDDILVFYKDEEEHEVHLHNVLPLLRSHQFYAQPAKCNYFQEEVAYSNAQRHGGL